MSIVRVGRPVGCPVWLPAQDTPLAEPDLKILSSRRIVAAPKKVDEWSLTSFGKNQLTTEVDVVNAMDVQQRRPDLLLKSDAVDALPARCFVI